MSNPRLLAIHRTLALAGAALLCTAWLVPIHYSPWTSFYNDLCAGVALAILAVALLPLRKKYEIPAVAWALFAVSLIPWVQWFARIVTYSGDAWVATLYLFGFGTAVAVGYQFSERANPDLPVLLSGAALIAAAVSSVIGADQFLNGIEGGLWMSNHKAGMPALGNLGQANNLATLIGFGALGLFLLCERRLLSPWIGGCLLVLLIVGAGLTRSRTGLLYGPVLLASLFLYRRHHPNSFKTRLSTVAAATALHYVVALGAPALQRTMTGTNFGATLIDRGLASTRLDAWRMFIDALNTAPWTGFGWLETAEAQFSVADSSSIGEFFSYAHNFALELLVWCGYPLGTALVALCAYWIVFRAKKILYDPLISHPAPLCGFLVVLLFGIHSLLELPYHYAYFLIPIGLWIGVIERSIRSKSFGHGGLNWITVAAPTVLLIALARDYVLVQRDFDSARIAFEQGNTSSVRSIGPTPLMSELEAYTQFLRTTPTVGLSQTELDALRDGAKRYPTVYNLTTCSLMLAVNGKADEARNMFLKIPSLHGQRRFEPIKRYLHALIEQQKDTPLAPALQALEDSLPP